MASVTGAMSRSWAPAAEMPAMVIRTTANGSRRRGTRIMVSSFTVFAVSGWTD